MRFVVAGQHLIASTIVALDREGREHLVVVAKASWSIPASGARPGPIAPTPFVVTDEFHGEPGASAMRHGADFARFKPRCDVVFDASAHAPDGQAVTELVAAWQVGPLKKGVRVLGPRVWRKRAGLILAPSAPEPFLKVPLHYGLAFGGTREYKKARGSQPSLSECQDANPDGIGWFGRHTKGEADGAPVPFLEALDDPVTSPDGKHAPIAFSPIARHWMPRRGFAGTYDDAWRKQVFPLLPADFDEQYHQCAPTDQQMPYPKGREPVVLRNLMAGRPDVRFRLPALDALKLRVLRHDYSSASPTPVVDTLIFEPDAGRFSAIWRASVPIRRRLQEFHTIAIGPVDPLWWEALRSGRQGGCADCDDEAQPSEIAA